MRMRLLSSKPVLTAASLLLIGAATLTAQPAQAGWGGGYHGGFGYHGGWAGGWHAGFGFRGGWGGWRGGYGVGYVSPGWGYNYGYGWRAGFPAYVYAPAVPVYRYHYYPRVVGPYWR